MQRILLTVLSIAALAASAAIPLETRISEIAAWLPETPSADGRPATDRAAWNRYAASREGKSTLSRAIAALNAPVADAPDELYLEFTRNGNRTHYQKRCFARLANLSALYVAECMERKGRFIPKLVEYLDAVCVMRSWTLPAHDGSLSCFNGKPHVDLVSSSVALSLAMCLSWLGDALPADVRAKVYSEIDRRTFQPYLDHARGTRKISGHWWFHGGNNWNSVCNCCVVRAALAVVPDRRLRAEFVAHAEGAVPYALTGYTEDGYCSEGMGYWNYGYGHFLEMGLSVRAATGGHVDFFANPKTKEVMRYAYGYQIQSGISPNFADGGGNSSPYNLALGRQIWPDLVNTRALQSPPCAGSAPEFSLRAFGQEPAPCAPTMDILPPRSWFKDAQVLLARVHRDGKPALDFGIAVKGGHNNELHNHNDLGSYTVLLDGCEMVGDPGGEVYTRRTFSRDRYVSKVLNSYAHPVPMVGGTLQLTGRAAAAKVLKADFTPARDTLVLDLNAGYGVKTLQSLTRTVVFDRTAFTFTVTDRVAFSAPTAFSVPVITYRDYTADAAQRHFVFAGQKKGARKLALDVAATVPLRFAAEKVENPERPDVIRLGFATAEPVAAAELTARYAVCEGL